MAAADQLTGLLNLINGIKGSSQTTTTSGGSQTQQVQLSDEAVNEQIKKILAGSGGVADIGNAARKSGLYNSTSEELLLGNLYASAAAQGEIARAPVVTTSAPQTQTTETPGVGIGTALGTIAGAAVLNSVLNSGGNVVGTGISDLLSGILGTGSNSSKKSTDLDLTGVEGGFNFDPTLGSVGVSGGFSEGLGSSFSGDIFGSQMGLGLSGIGEGSVGASGNVGKGSEDFDLVGSITSGLGGLLSGGGLGGFLGAITGGTGASFGSGGGGGGSSGGSVICTALMERGELDAELYKIGSEYLENLNPLVKVGYHCWAIGVAEKIRKGSKVANVICRPLARSRTALLATSGSFWDHVKHPLGTITKFIGEPVCYAIGWVLVTGALHREIALELNAPFGLK